MALARLALKNLQQRCSLPSYQCASERTVNSVQKQRWGSELLRRISSAAGKEDSAGQQVAVSEGGEKSNKLFPKKKQRRSLWKKEDDDFPPPLWEFFPSGLGNALVQASENINRLLGNLSPSRLLGKFKEQDDLYKLRLPVPGLAKEDVKVTVDDGVLTIKGERKEEEEGTDDDDDDHWASFYGYYNTSVLLPDDAKVDEIRAEMKDGVLTVIIPRTERPKKDVKEISVH
ncbi:26.5 kDa heat shock protein, mitochondrial-like [Coffea arabica]|uniref:26.5 kDa heat shock protein, mitochondrial-like n=1 Tax=Coffea arabica TaxID=13443 RepID=A0A6P6XKJ0_COFAR|nr:26.5 kDa heat shock protein, mitochondrial-like isoform X1 [Coffea arabica]XP_027126570.1 26.5 kDa heat shock protein, mitochondrial-like isoform X1 [Coffea arabica]XP_027126571.1 26.5 kDa heat shock protein, mitochondrial-like isoform X1 [Coffea arabica]XP_027126572.1 26.5 kDa heat shock protein, mitochondrial-like isoform X1 [Coffea arabica]XP_027126573.1 26.5 kDa heat shock protein, mitochondrial-like isoform X1 [Coffea arabica]XP_027126574.1 26.5 kDa heat shock protein, mitochondrial-li